MRYWVDTRGFVQGGSSTRQEERRSSPVRGQTSSRVSAAQGTPPQRYSPIGVSHGLPDRIQATQVSSSDRKERTTQAVPPSLRRSRGLDELVPEEDVSVGASPLKTIDADETVFKNGLPLCRPAVSGLNVARYYQPHNALVAWP